jgi:ABC-type uncharacterized transport system permease subunit
LTLLRRIGRALRPLGIPALAVLLSFVVGSIFLIITDIEHLKNFGTDPLGSLGASIDVAIRGYGAMLAGAFGDPGRIVTALQGGTERQVAAALRPITETLVASTPLMFTGLAVAVSFRAGVFNIGAEGQFLLGALGAAVTAIVLGEAHVPPGIILIAGIVMGTLSGAIWGFIPGFLKARTGAHEVITTIMLNYVVYQIVLFTLRSEFLRPPGVAQPISKVLTQFVTVPHLFPDLIGIRLHIGFIVALLMAVLLSWFMFRTTKGFELRTSGLNPTAARYAGMSAGGSIMLAMAISGGLSGLGGTFEALGTVGQMSNDLSPGYGWTAIALALLGGTRPGGVVLAALLFGALRTGGALMQVQTSVPLDLLSFIQALVIMFVAAPGLTRTIFRLRSGPAQEGAPV